jgi:uncharacterized protein (UPF0335 family)
MSESSNKATPSQSAIQNKQPAADKAADGSELLNLFKRFLELEEKSNSVNAQKAEVFGDAKSRGFDTKAVRAAFRHRVRELDKPEPTAIHDKRTAEYLVTLRGAGTMEALTRTREGASDGPVGGGAKGTGSAPGNEAKMH